MRTKTGPPVKEDRKNNYISSNPKRRTKNLFKLFNEVITCIAFALDLDEHENLFHAWRVTILATRLAEKVNPESYDYTYYAGLLHDIGCIGLKDHLTYYPTLAKQLSNPLIKDHPYKGAEMVRLIPGLFPSADLIFQHHERYDGKGYPIGLKGDAILPGAQFLRVSDAFDLWLRNQGRPQRRNGESAPPSFIDFYKSFGNGASREFSEDILFSFLDLLRDDHLYHAILRKENLSLLLQQTAGGLRGIELRPNVDLVGTALNLFAEIIDAKHTYTQGHSKRVTEYAMALALALGLPHDEITKIKWASLLHDVGKVAVPQKILDKPGPLTQKEWRVVKKHPVLTVEVLNMISAFPGFAEIAGCHQERYDGKGYPNRLKGEEIPLGARILATADALDAMTSSRPYRPTWTFKEALREILKESEKHFDPKVAKTANLIFGSN